MEHPTPPASHDSDATGTVVATHHATADDDDEEEDWDLEYQTALPHASRSATVPALGATLKQAAAAAAASPPPAGPGGTPTTAPAPHTAERLAMLDSLQKMLARLPVAAPGGGGGAGSDNGGLGDLFGLDPTLAAEFGASTVGSGGGKSLLEVLCTPPSCADASRDSALPLELTLHKPPASLLGGDFSYYYASSARGGPVPGPSAAGVRGGGRSAGGGSGDAGGGDVLTPWLSGGAAVSVHTSLSTQGPNSNTMTSLLPADPAALEPHPPHSSPHAFLSWLGTLPVALAVTPVLSHVGKAAAAEQTLSVAAGSALLHAGTTRDGPITEYLLPATAARRIIIHAAQRRGPSEYLTAAAATQLRGGPAGSVDPHPHPSISSANYSFGDGNVNTSQGGAGQREPSNHRGDTPAVGGRIPRGVLLPFATAAGTSSASFPHCPRPHISKSRKRLGSSSNGDAGAELHIGGGGNSSETLSGLRGGDCFSLSGGGLEPATALVRSIDTLPLAPGRRPARLVSLLAYPHACILSDALPLAYFEQVRRARELQRGKGAERRLSGGQQQAMRGNAPTAASSTDAVSTVDSGSRGAHPSPRLGPVTPFASATSISPTAAPSVSSSPALALNPAQSSGGLSLAGSRSIGSGAAVRNATTVFTTPAGRLVWAALSFLSAEPRPIDCVGIAGCALHSLPHSPPPTTTTASGASPLRANVARASPTLTRDSGSDVSSGLCWEDRRDVTRRGLLHRLHADDVSHAVCALVARLPILVPAPAVTTLISAAVTSTDLSSTGTEVSNISGTVGLGGEGAAGATTAAQPTPSSSSNPTPFPAVQPPAPTALFPAATCAETAPAAPDVNAPSYASSQGLGQGLGLAAIQLRLRLLQLLDSNTTNPIEKSLSAPIGNSSSNSRTADTGGASDSFSTLGGDSSSACSSGISDVLAAVDARLCGLQLLSPGWAQGHAVAVELLIASGMKSAALAVAARFFYGVRAAALIWTSTPSSSSQSVAAAGMGPTTPLQHAQPGHTPRADGSSDSCIPTAHASPSSSTPSSLPPPSLPLLYDNFALLLPAATLEAAVAIATHVMEGSPPIDGPAACAWASAGSLSAFLTDMATDEDAALAEAAAAAEAATSAQRASSIGERRAQLSISSSSPEADSNTPARLPSSLVPSSTLIPHARSRSSPNRAPLSADAAARDFTAPRRPGVGGSDGGSAFSGGGSGGGGSGGGGSALSATTTGTKPGGGKRTGGVFKRWGISFTSPPQSPAVVAPAPPLQTSAVTHTGSDVSRGDVSGVSGGLHTDLISEARTGSDSTAAVPTSAAAAPVPHYPSQLLQPDHSRPLSIVAESRRTPSVPRPLRGDDGGVSGDGSGDVSDGNGSSGSIVIGETGGVSGGPGPRTVRGVASVAEGDPGPVSTSVPPHSRHPSHHARNNTTHLDHLGLATDAAAAAVISSGSAGAGGVDGGAATLQPAATNGGSAAAAAASGGAAATSRASPPNGAVHSSSGAISSSASNTADSTTAGSPLVTATSAAEDADAIPASLPGVHIPSSSPPPQFTFIGIVSPPLSSAASSTSSAASSSVATSAPDTLVSAAIAGQHSPSSHPPFTSGDSSGVPLSQPGVGGGVEDIAPSNSRDSRGNAVSGDSNSATAATAAANGGSVQLGEGGSLPPPLPLFRQLRLLSYALESSADVAAVVLGAGLRDLQAILAASMTISSAAGGQAEPALPNQPKVMKKRHAVACGLLEQATPIASLHSASDRSSGVVQPFLHSTPSCSSSATLPNHHRVEFPPTA